MPRRFKTTLLDAASAADATGIGVVNDVDVANCQEFGFDVEFDHTAGAGVVLIESASSSSYAGTWATQATVTFAAIDKSHHVALTGVFAALRARISSAVTSGHVTVTAYGG